VLTAEEVVIEVRLPKWILEEARKRNIGKDAIARAAVKLALLEEILSRHGLEEEDLEWLMKRRKIKRQ